MKPHPTMKMMVEGATAGVSGALLLGLWYLSAAALGIGPSGAFRLEGHAALLVGLFAATGAFSGLLLGAAQKEKALLTPLLIFVLAFEVFAAANILEFGLASQQAGPWWEVTVGSLLSAGAMLAALSEMEPWLTRNLAGPWVKVVREGAVGGLFAAAGADVWFLLSGAIVPESLNNKSGFSAALFGHAIGARPTLVFILGFVLLSLIICVAVGVAAAAFLQAARTKPSLIMPGVVVLLLGEVGFFGAVTGVRGAGPEELGWWQIIVANLLAIASMAEYFAHRPAGGFRLALQKAVEVEAAQAAAALTLRALEVECPATREAVIITIERAPLRAASAPALRLVACSNWPRYESCDRACLARLHL